MSSWPISPRRTARTSTSSASSPWTSRPSSPNSARPAGVRCALPHPTRPCCRDRCESVKGAQPLSRSCPSGCPRPGGGARPWPPRPGRPSHGRDPRAQGRRAPLAALKSIRASRPGGYRLFVILGNLAANKTPAIRRWARRENAGLCLTPTNASWANPIEAHFGPLRTIVMGTCDHPNHPALARRLQAYLRWRNAHTRHPDVLAAQRRERARIRSERQQRWGRPRPKAA
jgi:hypothetical protein